MSIDVFNNRASTTVSSGGTTAPAAGTVETWTVASSAKWINVASSGATPPTQHRVTDPADATGEIMLVTNQSGTGLNTWTVTRGVEGTTPVAHASGFVAQAVITAAGLDNRYAPMGGALFESYVRANSPDQLAPAAANVPMGGFRMTGMAKGLLSGDAAIIDQLGGGLYGDGSDGACIADGQTGVSGGVGPGASVLGVGNAVACLYYQTRDCYFTTMSIPTGAAWFTNGYRLFVNGVLQMGSGLGVAGCVVSAISATSTTVSVTTSTVHGLTSGTSVVTFSGFTGSFAGLNGQTFTIGSGGFTTTTFQFAATGYSGGTIGGSPLVGGTASPNIGGGGLLGWGAGTLTGSVAGGTGGSGVGGNGTNVTNALGGVGGTGGTAGTTTHAGGTGGTVTGPGAGAGSVRAIPWALVGATFGAGGALTAVNGGSSGGAGGGDGTNSGGAGGVGGGVVIIAARYMNPNTGYIPAYVTSGLCAGAAATAGNAGGGGGGGGALVIIVSDNPSTMSVVNTGGAGGAGHGTGAAGAAGAAGTTVLIATA